MCDSNRRTSINDRVIFEHVADQYVQGVDVTAFFTIQSTHEINPKDDQIGLLRVGCTDIKKCLAYASIQFNPSTTPGSFRSGTAKFSSSTLPVTNDEFYQFCYIHQRTINFGSSIPFQLNCPLDDIDYLLNTSTGKPNELAAFDNDNDVVIITHENFHPVNRSASKPVKDFNDSNRLRSQLSATLQLTKDQATHIVELERQLMQANQSIKQSNQQRLILEQQHRDYILTSEKRQRTLEGQIQSSNNQRQLQDLTLTHEKYRRSIQGQLKHSTDEKLQLERELRDSKLVSEKYQRSTQGQLNAYSKQSTQRDDQEMQTPNESNDQAYQALKSSFDTIEKRCVKHQQNEVGLKRQLMIYQKFITDLQQEIEHLNDRVTTNTDEYNTLCAKYNALKYQMKSTDH